MNKSYVNSLFVLGMSHLLIDLILGVWPIYKTIVGLDVGKASLIAGICLIVGEAAQLLFGYLGTRFCLKKLVVIGICLVGMVGVLSHVSSYSMIFIVILSIYLGSGAFHPSATGMMGHWCEKSQGIFITLFYTGGTIGAALSQIVFSWSWTFFGGETLVFLLPVALMLVWLSRHSFKKASTEGNKPTFSCIFYALRHNKRLLIQLFSIQVMVQTIIVTLMFLLPDLLKSRGYANWLVMGGGDFFFVIGAAVFGLLAGYLYKRSSFQRILLTASVASVIFFYCIVFAMGLHALPLILLLVLVGGALGTITPMILVRSSELVPKNMRSLVSGVFMGGATCFAGIGVAVAGVLTSLFVADPLTYTLGVMGFLLFIASISATIMAIRPLKGEGYQTVFAHDLGNSAE